MFREQYLEARLAALQRLATELAHATSHAQLARVILDATVDAIGAHAASLWELTGRAPRLIEAVGAPPEDDRIVQLGSTPTWGDVDVVLPLLAGGGAIGALVYTYAAPHTFEPDERGFLVAVANHAAAAMRAVTTAQRLATLQEADAANRTKTAFLAMLGHELRNPLAPIVSALDLLRNRGQLDRELGVIDRQVRYLTGMLDDLLDVSRITRGRIDLVRTSVPLREAIDAALERTEPLVAKHKHEVTLAIAPLVLDADRGRLVQVLVNLITNAAQYTPPGGQIAITAGADGDRAVVQVRDTGVGIAPALLPELFELFSQGERTYDRAQGGLGLGLAIAKNLIGQHGGTIAAHSSGVGHGAELTVHWPLAPVRAEPLPPPLATLTGKPLRVLVVDDNVAAAELLGEILRYLGHDPIVAHDGASALARAEAAAPHVALVDIGLPVIDGYELATRLRALPQLATTRLIALSGYDQLSDRERSARAGFDDHVAKPIDQASLAELLRASGE